MQRHDGNDPASTPPDWRADVHPAGRQGAERNRLLRGMPAAEYAALRPHLARTFLGLQQVLTGPPGPADDVYFPERAVAALMKPVGDALVEVGSVGREGLIGLGAYLDGGAAPRRAVVQAAGDARRVPAAVLVAAAEARPALRHFLNRYAHACLVALEAEVGCERGHPLAARCARRLLVTRDRAGAAEFPLTHEALAASLGVRRAGVSAAVGAFTAAGLVRARRGRVAVLDRAGLEARACSCYREVWQAFDALRRPADP